MGTQGGEQHFNYYRQQHRKMLELETSAHSRMSIQYNGLLRRLNDCSSVLVTFKDALNSMLPDECVHVPPDCLLIVA